MHDDRVPACERRINVIAAVQVLIIFLGYTLNLETLSDMNREHVPFTYISKVFVVDIVIALLIDALTSLDRLFFCVLALYLRQVSTFPTRRMSIGCIR